MVGKVFWGILAVFVLLGALATPINTGIKGWRTTNTTESFAATTTAASVTTANVTLGHDLFQYAVSEVIAITSTDGSDAAVASSYNSTAKRLLVAGLNDDSTRTLTVNYYADSDSTVMQVIGPFLSVLILGGLLCGIFFGIFHKGRR